ncbi:DUF5954 family protein [Streptomyces sp. TRM70350]|uniref:DUF5954 family protein n=1 Tax=Streptomyces sp. TRM70350 TaxID=2856165 RepID=UPI001C49110A|nr:DUF5954 family protein [Streptomyces sp. TRM70350]MBV7700760.1 hypothetical protein [Streptomyces sp. TRM70350]
MNDDQKRQRDEVHTAFLRRDDPAAWVTETDALDATRRYPLIALRGPVFGVAVQDPRTGPHWRVVRPVTDGTPQEARDSLNSSFWFRAKDDTDDPAVRRELLAAVALLEREPVDGLEVLGVRYRVVRGDEFTRVGAEGLEPPRPTDREPATPSWDDRDSAPSPDLGFVLDPRPEDTSMARAALRLGLREFAYTGARFPTAVREHSLRAVTTHPDIALLPVGFGVAERHGGEWEPRGALMPTPHAARRLLYDGMTEFWPLLHHFDDRKRAEYARAAQALKSSRRVNRIQVADTEYVIIRIERLLRLGPDGPEPPRPSDQDAYGPSKIHPTMTEDGRVRHDD